METVSASLEQQQLEDVISSMFKAAGFENKEDLSLDDFIRLMGDHKEELSQAALTVQGKCTINICLVYFIDKHLGQMLQFGALLFSLCFSFFN